MLKRKALFGLVTGLALSVMGMAALPIAAQDATAVPTLVPTLPPATDIPEIQLGTGGTHISFWNGLTGSDGATMSDLLAGFVKEHPEISVTMQEIPWATMYTKLQAAFVAGTPPDVVIMHGARIPQFGSYGVLMDLGSWYKDKGGFFPGDDVSQITRSAMDYQGVTYGIPLDNHGRGLWINKGAFKKAGLDPAMAEPVGYDNWVKLFQQLTIDKNGKNAADPAFDKDNVVQWGYTVGEWPFVNWLAALSQHGGSWVSEDGKTVTVNSEAGIAALQEQVDLVYKYHVSPPASGFDTWGGFAAGAVAILPTGTWFRNQSLLDTDIDSQPWTAAQFGDKPGTYMGIHTFTVPATETGAQLDAVKTMIEWVSNNQKGWAASGQVPARLSTQAELDPTNYPSNILLGKSMAASGVLDFASPAMGDLINAIDPEINAALNGQETAKEALDNAQARMQQALDRAAAGG